MKPHNLHPRRAILCLTAMVVALLALAGSPSADDFTQNVAGNFSSSSRAVIGPAEVRWIGINPLRYPSWKVTINDVVVSGPDTSKITSTAASLAAIDSNLAPPSPGPLPTDVTFLPRYIPDEPALPKISGCNLDKLSDGKSGSDDPYIKAINDCYTGLGNKVAALTNETESSERELAKYIDVSNALIGHADEILADPDSQRNPDGSEPARGDYDTRLRNLDAHVAEQIIGVPLPSRISRHSVWPVPGSAVDIVRATRSIQDWPTVEITAASEQITLLLAIMNAHEQAFPTPTPTPTPKLSAPQKRSPSLRPLIFPKSSTLPTPATKRVGETLGAEQSESAECVPVVNHAYVDLGREKQCKDALQHLADRLAPLTKGKDAEGNYTKALATLRQFVTVRLDSLTPARFHYVDAEKCKGLNTSRRDLTFTLILDQNNAVSVKVVCQSRLIVTEGVGFSFLPQQSFATVPYNTFAPGSQPPLPSPHPNPLPSGAGFIQAVNVSQIRPIPVTLLNYKLFPTYGEFEVMSTFGIGVGSSQTSNYVDYVSGVSVALGRAAMLTFGVHLGAETTLQPGYKLNDFIVGPPPVTTTYTRAFVLVASYGAF